LIVWSSIRGGTGKKTVEVGWMVKQAFQSCIKGSWSRDQGALSALSSGVKERQKPTKKGSDRVAVLQRWERMRFWTRETVFKGSA